MDLTLSYSPVALALLVLVAGGVAAWTYRRNRPPLTVWKSRLLGVLRGLTFALVLLLLFGAVWHRLSSTEEEALIALLVDTSESLTVEHDGEVPSGTVRDALRALPDDPALRTYTFDGDVAALRDDGADSLVFDGNRTDISAALERVASDFEGRNLQGVILLSDGRVTSGRNPLYLAERYPAPIHTAVVGDTTSRVDVRLARVLTNDIAYVGVPLPVRAGITAHEFEGRQTSLRIAEGGSVLGSETVTLPPNDREISTELTITPTKPGLRRYTITVAPLDGEATTRNNTETVAVRVLEQERSILLVSGAPGPDLTALRSTLEESPNVDLTVRTQRGPGSFYEGALPGGLSAFDLVILLGYPGRASSPANANRIASAVGQGLPVLFWLTSQTDLQTLSSLFGDHLPLQPSAPTFSGVSSQVAFVPGAEGHPIFDGIEAEAWGQLPPLLISESPWTLRPGARALLHSASQGSETLAAIREGNETRSAAFLGTGSWRWRTLPEGLARFSSVYPNLVGNLVQWMAARKNRRPVRVRPDRTLFGDREHITFTGQVYGEDLVPIADARVTLTIRSDDRQSEQTVMRPLGNGRYVAEFAPRPTGTYSFHAEAVRGSLAIGTDSGSFGVGGVAIEYRHPEADAALMRRLAKRSGGQSIDASQLSELFATLKNRGTLETRELVSDTETPLIGLPLLLAILIGLLTAEWVLRKRWGLR